MRAYGVVAYVLPMASGRAPYPGRRIALSVAAQVQAGSRRHIAPRARGRTIGMGRRLRTVEVPVLLIAACVYAGPMEPHRYSRRDQRGRRIRGVLSIRAV